jgi:RND superfamily putative drug exporter
MLAAGFRRASTALLGTGISGPWGPSDPETRVASLNPEVSGEHEAAPDPRQKLVDELLRASEGAGQIAEGAGLARHQVSTILDDPVGRRALDRLLVDAETVRANPDLNRSFAAYITPDGHKARLDLAMSDRVFSAEAMDEAEALRRRVEDFLSDATGPPVRATLAGTNVDSAEIRSLTRADQRQSWLLIPTGVFLVLLVALRDPLACVNLVATMLLTYAFALGATHLVFVHGFGAEGLDWKVPYFLFVLLVAVGVDYNVFLMARLHEESSAFGLRSGIVRAIGQTGGLITSAAAITACSFASFLTSPLISLRQLGFALVVGIVVDALLVRPLLVPCGHWLLCRRGRSAVNPQPASGSIPIALN